MDDGPDIPLHPAQVFEQLGAAHLGQALVQDSDPEGTDLGLGQHLGGGAARDRIEAFVERYLLEFVGRIAAHQNDTHLFLVPAQLPKRLHPVDLRHPYVQITSKDVSLHVATASSPLTAVVTS